MVGHSWFCISRISAAERIQPNEFDNRFDVGGLLRAGTNEIVLLYENIGFEHGYIPMEELSGIPENYLKHPELLRFIAAQQMPWRESKRLAGEIGEYIVMARQVADGAWLVAAAGSESPRELDVPLSFLPAGKHEALVIQDGPTSDYRTHAEDYLAEKRDVSSADTLHLKLVPSGGACVLITKKR